MVENRHDRSHKKKQTQNRYTSSTSTVHQIQQEVHKEQIIKQSINNHTTKENKSTEKTLHTQQTHSNDTATTW